MEARAEKSKEKTVGSRSLFLRETRPLQGILRVLFIVSWVVRSKRLDGQPWKMVFSILQITLLPATLILCSRIQVTSPIITSNTSKVNTIQFLPVSFAKKIREINLVNCQDFAFPQILREINFDELVV